MDRVSAHVNPVARAIKGLRPVHFVHFRSLVILLWIWLVYYGERTAFDSAIARCEWSKWEPWAAGASPHHMVLLADPQLVDAHTYPGRPWPLSSLTVRYTDRYLRRSYSRIRRVLDPDSIYFLGDLFDGGREWRTGAQGFRQTDKRWVRYSNKYWKREYRRFADIFLRGEEDAEQRRRHRDMILSIPGNHDIGFGPGIQPVVRNRFQTYFGESNRVDIFGNHTFVGLDTVSLSAMNGPSEAAGIWKPTFDFLENVQEAIRHKTDVAFGHHRTTPVFEQQLTEHAHNVRRGNAETSPGGKQREMTGIRQLPIVAMSHIPLYRGPGTPCGPLRERSPPSAPGLANDEPNAIRVAGGYQYQNVLTKEVTELIANKLQRTRYAFSGDDHDYCELTHRAYASAGTGIKEVTVKSMSWAMGIRKPGFLLVSLWNPVDRKGESTTESPHRSGRPTLSSQLCLLPDQLAIFIRYAWCLAFTALGLAGHALVAARRDKLGKRGGDVILPLNTNVGGAVRELDSPSMNSNVEFAQGNAQARVRNNSFSLPSSGQGRSGDNIATSKPLFWQLGHRALGQLADGHYNIDDDEDKGIERRNRNRNRNRQRGLIKTCLDRFSWDLGTVAFVVGAYYLWLLHRG